jgi:hypothetical protein
LWIKRWKSNILLVICSNFNIFECVFYGKQTRKRLPYLRRFFQLHALDYTSCCDIWHIGNGSLVRLAVAKYNIHRRDYFVRSVCAGEVTRIHRFRRPSFYWGWSAKGRRMWDALVRRRVKPQRLELLD